MVPDPVAKAVEQTVQERPIARLIITAYSKGRVEVNGPIADKRLCYNMLVDAAVAIADFKPQPAVIIPTIIPPGNLRPS